MVPERTGRPSRPKAPYKVAPKDLCYATAVRSKRRKKKGRVVEVVVRGAVFGTLDAVKAALKRSLG
ncbi:MAG: hypothetical protein QOI57_1759 [Rubrobacteraceae bacterium]|nr:hypothetical protein [Rubrobacteraceae bacterium]